MTERKIKIINWVTIVFILFLSGFWAFWGIIENFHEGWYFVSLWKNIALSLIQYLSMTLILTILALVSIRWHKIGGILWIIGWLGFSYFIFFGGNIPFSLRRLFIWLPITAPLLLVGLSFYFYEIKNRKTAYMLIISIPLLIIFAFGIPNLLRVNSRYNDHNFGLRIVQGNGVKLEWAPKGPGFPEKGVDWFEAKKRCLHLNEKGDKLLKEEQNIWRLPTREEIVRSLTRKNKNCGGKLTKEGGAVYKISPDKETPLWDPNSMIIYYWTSESKGDRLVYMVSYNGRILSRYGDNGAGYHGFRCVRNIDSRN